jgi:E3 ubiquitin-protein ligase HECTD1
MQIKDFPDHSSPTDTDLILIWDAATNSTKKIKLSELKAYFGIPSTQTKELTYSSDGDSNGVCYWLGTNYGKESWVNPHTANRLAVFYNPFNSDNNNSQKIVDRQASDYTASSDTPNSFVRLDLGEKNKLICNYYSIRGNNYNGFLPRSWKIQASSDNSIWVDLDTQADNSSINQNVFFSKAVASSTAYRYFRMLQTGLNSSGNNILALGEFEFYGTLQTEP